MHTAIQVDFDGMQPIPTLRASVLEHVKALEDRFGRICACRVVLKQPGGHHRQGEPYAISIRAALPDGREIHVHHGPTEDPRHADLGFALNDAFKRARRQLQDQISLMSGR